MLGVCHLAISMFTPEGLQIPCMQVAALLVEHTGKVSQRRSLSGRRTGVQNTTRHQCMVRPESCGGTTVTAAGTFAQVVCISQLRPTADSNNSSSSSSIYSVCCSVHSTSIRVTCSALVVAAVSITVLSCCHSKLA